LGVPAPAPSPDDDRSLAGPVRAVFGATGLVRFGFGLTVSIFAAYIAGHSSGFSTSDVGTIGLVSGMSPIGEFTTVIGSGILADRHGRYPVLLAGLIGATVLLFAVSLTRDPYALGALNFGFGVASGAILASSLAVIGDWSARRERGVEMGRFDAANLVGWIGGFAVGFALLAELPNPELGWVFRAGAAVLLGGLVFTYVEFGPEAKERSWVRLDVGRLLAALGRRDVVLVTAPWFVIYLLLGTVFVFLGTASSGVGVPPLDLAAAIGVGGLVLVFTQPAYGRLADRRGRTGLMLVGAIGFLLVLTGAGLLATYGESYPAIGAVAIGALFALGYGPAALASLTDLSSRISRGTTMAIYTLTISLGMWVGLVLSTGLYQRWGAHGLDLFFGSIGTVLAVLTAIRVHDVRSGRAVVGA
jgi:MFS family permease